MIDTQEKLDAVVYAHKVDILAVAMKEFVSTSDDDVWGTYWVSDEEQVDFNIYQQDDGPNLTVWAYALQHEMGDPAYALTVNTTIGAFVAHIDFVDN